MSRTGNHNSNCAKAGGHKCACSGCGGSLHGWQGWVGLAKGSDQDRRDKRSKIEDDWAKNWKPGTKSNAQVRAASTDFARLEVADWLGSSDDDGAQSGDTASPAGSDEGTAPVDETTTETPVSGTVSDHVEPESDGPATTPPPRPSEIEQVEILARSMTSERLWDEIAVELAVVSSDPRAVAGQLASHGWCDLFVGLVQVVEKCQGVVNEIPEWGKRVVKEAIRESSVQGHRPLITDAVIDVVVDKVWTGFLDAAVAGFPLLSVISSEETVRSLRILAAFTCPAPEKHREVRERALKPLDDEITGMITDETKRRLAKLFEEWKPDGDTA